MDYRFSVDQFELIFDCLIQSNGFMDFDRRGLPEIQEKFGYIKKEISQMLEQNNNPIMFFTVFMQYIGEKEKENVFQELALQVKEVIEFSGKIMEKNDIVFKSISSKGFFNLNNDKTQTRRDLIDATIDIKNLATFNLLMLQTIGRVLSYIGYGLSSDDLKPENEKGGG